MIEKIKVKYLADIPKLETYVNGDWIDLRAAEDVDMHPDEYKLIPLGIAVELPEGYEALIAPRSSTYAKFGIILANSLGIIDESYKGDDDQWHFPAYALNFCHISKGERICQFRIIKHQPELYITEVESIGNENRGGIGSTGTAEFPAAEKDGNT